MGHTAIKCYNRFDNNYNAEAFASLRISDRREWYPDSGASAHITSNTTGLQDVTTYEGNDTVQVGDGTYLPITHVGSATITSCKGTLPMNEVLVCPEIQKSLLSVSKLCDDYPCGVYFDSKKVCVIDLPTQKVVAKGPRSEGLYVLKNIEFEAYYSSRQRAASEDTWHQRLGHASFKVLQQLQSSKKIMVNKSRNTSICEPCQMGKNSRLEFLASDSVTCKPLDRIHCDLWGQSPVVSNQGFKYYAVFIDDFTRFSWLYPLRNKFDFFNVFTTFQKLV